MTNFGPKPWTNTFGKNLNFSTFLTSFYSIERRFFALEYHKTHFPGLDCLNKTLENGQFWPRFPKKEKTEKWSILDQTMD